MSEDQHGQVRTTPSGYTEIDVTGVEEWREYTFMSSFGEVKYRIAAPCMVVFRPEGTTHRVLSADGVVHCVPSPGHFGCVLTWKPAEGQPPYIR